MQNGVSSFKYFLLEDTVELDVRIKFQDDVAEIEEVMLADGVDVTEEILSFGLEEKLVQYAEEHEDYFIADEVTAAESKWESDNDR